MNKTINFYQICMDHYRSYLTWARHYRAEMLGSKDDDNFRFYQRGLTRMMSKMEAVIDLLTNSTIATPETLDKMWDDIYELSDVK